MDDIKIIPVPNYSSYLLRQRGKTILVDSSPPGTERKMVRALWGLGVATDAISLTVLTHYHADHSGTADYLRKRFGVKIAMHPADSHKFRPLTARNIMGGLIVTASKAMLGEQQLIVPDYPLEEGLGLHSYGIDAEIICLPGHTAGSIGVLTSSGALLCGDALMNFGGPSLCHIAEDFTTARETLAKIANLKVTVIYPGHGKPFAPNEIKGL